MPQSNLSLRVITSKAAAARFVIRVYGSTAWNNGALAYPIETRRRAREGVQHVRVAGEVEGHAARTHNVESLPRPDSVPPNEGPDVI